MSTEVTSSHVLFPETRHIYPETNFRHDRQVGLYSNQDHDNYDDGLERTLSKKKLRYKHHINSYDAWRDIYMNGNLNRHFEVESNQPIADRKSQDDSEYDDDYFYYYADTDFKARPNPKRRRPHRNRPQQSRRKSGLYDYEEPLTYDEKEEPSSSMYSFKTPQRKTSNVTNVSTFGSTAFAIFAVLAIPFLLAAGYWLFVVNGPTPVVKARIDDPEYLPGNEKNEAQVIPLIHLVEKFSEFFSLPQGTH